MSESIKDYASYVVWVDIEGVTDDGDGEDITLEATTFGRTATFDTLDEATAFAHRLHLWGAGGLI